MVPPASALLQQWWLPPLTFGMGCCICQWTVSSINVCCTLMATNPTITPFAIHVGQLSSCFFSTGLHFAALPSLQIWKASLAKFTGICHTFQSSNSQKHTFSHTKGSLQPDGLPLHIWRVLSLVSGTTFPFECINHAQSGMIHQASYQGLQHPLKQKFSFPSATVMIWVSQYDHELTTLPRVYSSRSCACPLFHPRNHALLLLESLALNPKSPGSSPPLTYGGNLLKVDPYMSWYSEYYNAITEFTTLTRVNLFKGPAHALCSFIAAAS